MTITTVALLSYSLAWALVSPPPTPEPTDDKLAAMLAGLKVWHEESQKAFFPAGVAWTDNEITKYLAYTRRFWIDFRRLLYSPDDPKKADKVAQRLGALGARGVPLATLRIWAAELAHSREELPQRIAAADPRRPTIEQTKARVEHLIRAMEREMKGLRQDPIPAPDYLEPKSKAQRRIG